MALLYVIFFSFLAVCAEPKRNVVLVIAVCVRANPNRRKKLRTAKEA